MFAELEVLANRERGEDTPVFWDQLDTETAACSGRSRSSRCPSNEPRRSSPRCRGRCCATAWSSRRRCVRAARSCDRSPLQIQSEQHVRRPVAGVQPTDTECHLTHSAHLRGRPRRRPSRARTSAGSPVKSTVPRNITVTRSASPKTTSMSCSVIRTLRSPLSTQLSDQGDGGLGLLGGHPCRRLVEQEHLGSSASTTAISRRLRSPCESEPARCHAEIVEPQLLEQARRLGPCSPDRTGRPEDMGLR